MSSRIAILEAPLTANEIEVRVGMVGSNKNGVWATFLLYKTSRTDVSRLNRAFGTLWNSEYQYDQNGNLVCTISVYDVDNKIWSHRSDVGSESNSDAVKGSYSDALKRAGFRWGIGNELYDMPPFFTTLNEGEYYKNGDKFKAKLNGLSVAIQNGRIAVLDKNGVMRAHTHTPTPTPLIQELPVLEDITALIKYSEDNGLDIDTTITVAKEKYTVTAVVENEIVRVLTKSEEL